MKLKDILKERVKERLINERTSLVGSPGAAANSTRWTPPGQRRTLSVPQLSGYYQVEKPTAENPMPPHDDYPDNPDEEHLHIEGGIGMEYNNKIQREDDGELTASGMPGEAFASPKDYIDHHRASEADEATV